MGGGGGGFDHVPKVLRYFLPKHWEFWAFKKLPHICPKWADIKVTSQCQKQRGWGQGHFWTMSKRKKHFFILDIFPEL